MNDMKTWCTATGRGKASKEHLQIFDEVTRQIGKRCPSGLHVVSVALTNHLPDHYRSEVEVVLASDVRMTVSFQEDLQHDSDFTLYIDDFNFAAKVTESIESYLSVGIPSLRKEIRDIRAGIIGILPAWHEEGIDVRLVDVQLPSRDYWERSGPVTFEVTLSSLDALLRPDFRTFKIERSQELHAALEEFRVEMRPLFAMRSELRQHGADCFIDLLAYNAISSHGAAGRVLTPWLTRGSYPHVPGATVFEEEGRVRVHGSDKSERLQWNRDTVKVSNVALPELTLLNAIGRPITALLEHRLLSPEMKIVAASMEPKFNPNMDDDAYPQLSITFEQPLLLFSCSTGRATRRGEGMRQLPLI
jgi:hypothetical protein